MKIRLQTVNCGDKEEREREREREIKKDIVSRQKFKKVKE